MNNTSSSNTSLFTTGRGKPITISEESINKAQSLMNNTDTDATSLFTTGRGKPITISEESINKAQSLINTNNSLFTTGSGKPLTLSESSLHKASAWLQSEDPQPINPPPMNLSVPPSPIPLFSTASNKSITISEKSLQQAQHLLSADSSTTLPPKINEKPPPSSLQTPLKSNRTPSTKVNKSAKKINIFNKPYVRPRVTPSKKSTPSPISTISPLHANQDTNSVTKRLSFPSKTKFNIQAVPFYSTTKKSPPLAFSKFLSLYGKPFQSEEAIPNWGENSISGDLKNDLLIDIEGYWGIRGVVTSLTYENSYRLYFDQYGLPCGLMTNNMCLQVYKDRNIPLSKDHTCKTYYQYLYEGKKIDIRFSPDLYRLHQDLLHYGCDPSILSLEWVGNHYKQIVWKLACLERWTRQVNSVLTYSNVYIHLLWRYTTELEV